MSRFTATNNAGETFAYGFDRPLQEYFIQKYLPDGDSVDLVGFGSVPHIAGTNGNFLNAVDEHGIILPDNHLFEVGMDVPFGQLQLPKCFLTQD